MSSHYDPIPTDSDNENDHVSNTALMTDDEVRSDRTRSTDRSHFFQQNTTDSDEEEPEEDNPIDADPRSPRLTLPIFNFGMRPRVRQTARKRVPMPQVWTRSRSTTPEPSLPPTDPYVQPPTGFQIWERTLSTLQAWRNSGPYAPVPTGEGPSSVRQEFLLDTTPIIVDRVANHEDRLDMMESEIMEVPGNEAFEGLQDRVNDAEENISAVNDSVQSLKAKVELMTSDFSRMKAAMDKMEGKVDQSLTLARSAMAQVIYMTTPNDYKKKGKEDGNE